MVKFGAPDEDFPRGKELFQLFPSLCREDDRDDTADKNTK